MPEKSAIVARTSTSMGEVIIRYPQTEDVHDLLTFINTISLEQTYIHFQGEQLTLEQETSWLADRLSAISRGDAVLLGAFHEEQVIGTTGVERKRQAESHIGVFGISILQPYRGQGIGTAMMNAIFQETRQTMPGIQIIELSVFGNNEGARNLYQKQGFIEHGNLPGGIRHRDQYVDHILMHRRLNDR